MADPTKLSYKDLVSWSKGENDITAKTAKTLATARTITIKDNSATNAGPATQFNGGADIILKLPNTIKAGSFVGPLTGNVTGNVTGNCSGSAASATTATTATKLASNGGAANTPVYFSNGQPVAVTSLGTGSLPVRIPTAQPSSLQPGMIWLEE